ncbi:demethylmenaquinone methyltransferase [Micromonospora sp. WP24]|uniref:demethylmenaquinone methyltransferase n=1 Tax=Micromonospora sp. WP24 TaxID=2604469 RepID=UPI0011D80C15|nr:demethylmenaquinone methyltransferase [Micromonospora sp. WP24]TYB95499.1 demethylmenaquinone methyltransferase [Micromonospora sp. WP24]
MTRAQLDKQPPAVAAMFDGVAERYDLANRIISFGQDARWRRATRAALGLHPGERVLDVGAGTGVSTEELARSGVFAVGVDLSTGMLQVGRRVRPAVPLVAGDALRLPFPDGAFDAVTTSFALRNVVDLEAALREFARIVRPGGQLVVCECSHPTNPTFRMLYLAHLLRAVPVVTRWVSSNPDAYVYLIESIRAWPNQPDLAKRIAASGWQRVSWRNLSGGVAALHRATRC